MSKNGYDRFIEYQFGYSGSFFKLLFQTMFQADPKNLAKLARAFPEEAAAVDWFKNHSTGREFILKHCSPDNPLVKDIKEGKLIL